jgi:hypothetical protein
MHKIVYITKLVEIKTSFLSHAPYCKPICPDSCFQLFLFQATQHGSSLVNLIYVDQLGIRFQEKTIQRYRTQTKDCGTCRMENGCAKGEIKPRIEESMHQIGLAIEPMQNQWNLDLVPFYQGQQLRKCFYTVNYQGLFQPFSQHQAGFKNGFLINQLRPSQAVEATLAQHQHIFLPGSCIEPIPLLVALKIVVAHQPRVQPHRAWAFPASKFLALTLVK